MLRQSPRTLRRAARLPHDGRLRRRARAAASALGFTGTGVTAVVTDLGVLEPDPETCELTLTTPPSRASTPDEAREATGWELRVADELVTRRAPTDGRSSRRCARCRPSTMENGA